MSRPSDADERTQRAIRTSFLGTFPPEALDRLLASAVVIDVPAGGIIYRDEDPARGAVVLAGLVRVFLTSVDGRQLTVRYVRPGMALGAPTAVRGPAAASAQAVTDSVLLMFSATVLRELATTDVRVAWPLAEELAHRLYDALDAVAGSAFGSVRQRVAKHLLDLATAGQRGPELHAEVSQQALADAVGTAREVVARTLHDFRTARLIRTGRSGIVVLDPERLQSVVETGEL